LRGIDMPAHELVVDLIAVKPYGWIYLCNTRAFVDDGDLTACIIGDGPVVVPNDGGEPIALGSRLPTEQAIAKFERERGLLPPLVVVRFSGWQDPRSQRRVTLIKTIVSVLGWDLKPAMSVIDELAKTGVASVHCQDMTTANMLAEYARDLGVIVSLEEAPAP
jgi:hypothetical protein